MPTSNKEKACYKVSHIRTTTVPKLSQLPIMEESLDVMGPNFDPLFTLETPSLDILPRNYVTADSPTQSICSFCKMVIDNVLIFDHFELNHSRIVGPFSWPSCSCLLCNSKAKFPNEADLLQHQHFIQQNVGRKIAWVNPANKQLVRCNFCKSSISVLQMHPHFMTKHKEAFVNLTWCMCKSCHCKFPGREFFKDHCCAVKIKENMPEVKRDLIMQKVVCSYCHNMVDLNQIQTHYRIKHVDQFKATIWMKCEKCGLRFPTLQHLDQHQCTTKNQQDSQEASSSVNHSGSKAKVMKLTFPVPHQ